MVSDQVKSTIYSVITILLVLEFSEKKKVKVSNFIKYMIHIFSKHDTNSAPISISIPLIQAGNYTSCINSTAIVNQNEGS